MSEERQGLPEEMGRVVRFRPRISGTAARHPAEAPAATREGSPVGDIDRYERAGEDDYRHRMIMNVLALLVCLLLAGSGVWLANKIAEMRRNQDCVLSGRLNCARIDLPPSDRSGG
jgi:hypothetical protein